MEIKFDFVKPNLLVEENWIYVNVPREQLIPFAKDVDEIVGRNIALLQVRERDMGVITDNDEKKKSKNTIPLSEYLAAFKESIGQHGALTNPSYELFGAGDYLVDAWTLEKSEDVNPDKIRQTRDFLKNLGKHIKHIGECFGVAISEESAKKHLEERLAKLEEGLAERYGSLWVVSGLAPSKTLKTFYDDRIVVARVALGGRKENDDVVAKTKGELVEKLKAYDGERLSLDTPFLMEEAYRVHLDGPALMARYGDVLDNPDWRRRLIMLDN